MAPKSTPSSKAPSTTTIQDLNEDVLQRVRASVHEQDDRNAGVQVGIFKRKSSPLQRALMQLDQSRQTLADNIIEVEKLDLRSWNVNDVITSINQDLQNIKLSTVHIHNKLINAKRFNDLMKSRSPVQRGHEWLKRIASKHFNYNDLNVFTSMNSFLHALDGPLNDERRSDLTYTEFADDVGREWNNMIAQFGPAQLSNADRAKFVVMMELYVIEETDYGYTTPTAAEEAHIIELANLVDKVMAGGKGSKGPKGSKASKESKAPKAPKAPKGLTLRSTRA
jgi:hypothetical protein